MCDGCDRGFHLKCIAPRITGKLVDVYFCDDCVKCISCGATHPGPRKEDKWHRGYSLCTPCSKLYQKKQYCPVCRKVWKNDTPEAMIGCDQCGLWVHAKCDAIDDESHHLLSMDGSRYFCSICRESSRSKEIVDFKKRMRWLKRHARKRNKTALSLENINATASASEDGVVSESVASNQMSPAMEADAPPKPPEVRWGTVDKLVKGKLPTMKELPSETELRTWNLDSQTEFWHQRRRFWDKERRLNCQKACNDRQLSATGSKAKLVRALSLWDFHCSASDNPAETNDTTVVVDTATDAAEATAKLVSQLYSSKSDQLKRLQSSSVSIEPRGLPVQPQEFRRDANSSPAQFRGVQTPAATASPRAMATLRQLLELSDESVALSTDHQKHDASSLQTDAACEDAAKFLRQDIET
eukprot:SAG31_NODE_5608_length_2425_cov_0.995701_2_plen_411_part_01